MKLLYIPISAFLLLHATSTLVTSNSSRPRAHELSHDYSFEQYIVDFDKEYKYQSYTHEEYEIKRQIFQRNLEIILNHNKDVGYNLETGVSDGGDSSGHTFHMGVNHLSDLSKDEMQSYFGYDKSLHASYRTGATATSRRKLSKLTTNDHEMDLPFNITDVSTLPPFVKYNNTTPVSSVRFKCICTFIFVFVYPHLYLISYLLNPLCVFFLYRFYCILFYSVIHF